MELARYAGIGRRKTGGRGQRKRRIGGWAGRTQVGQGRRRGRRKKARKREKKEEEEEEESHEEMKKIEKCLW